MKFRLDDDGQMPSNVMLIPMVIPKEVYQLLVKAGAKQGKSAEQLFAEQFRCIIESVAESLKQGE